MTDLLAHAGTVSSGQREPRERTNSGRAEKTKAYPVSYAQQRLWFVDQLETGSAAYIIPCLLKLRGQLRREALRRSLDEIVRRHEILRTTFVVHEGVPLQRILPEGRVRVEETDLRNLPEAERDAEGMRLALAGATEPFDLARGPLLRVRLLQVDEHEHWLLLAMHHIVSDGWSLGIMVREFAALYQAYCAGETSPLPELGIQYLDYTLWQRGWLKGKVLEEQLGYWREQLADVQALDLPVENFRAISGSGAGATVAWSLTEELTSQLRGLARRQGATLFMTLMAAFQLLLSRYSGQKDIAIGTPIAGRRLTETEDLIGFFVNTLVIRTDLEGNPDFSELLRRVQETTLKGYVHQDVPFEKLVEVLHPERDLSRSALFQAMLVLQNAPRRELELPGLKISEAEIAATSAKFDLEMMAMEAAGKLSGILSYRSDLFTEAGMQRLLGYWRNLLTGIAANPQKAIGDFPLLSEVELRQLVEDWRHPETEQRQPPVWELFFDQALRTPGATALEYGTQRITYAELERRASAVARRLFKAGAVAGDVVLLLTGDRVTLIAAMIGSLRAGTAFVPMAPGLPDQRIAGMMTECAPAWAIVDPELEQRFAELAHTSEQNTRLVSLEAFQPDQNEAAPQTRIRGDGNELSYIFFTSGSTGKPKAIAGRLKGIDHFIRWEIETFGLGPECRVSQLTSPMFDPILRDVFVPLCCGGTVCIPPAPETLMSGSGLAQWLEQERITLLHTVPSIFRLMLNECDAPLRLERLKHVLLAGEPVLPSDIGKWRSLAGDEAARLVNLYGPSETTMVKFMYRVEGADRWRRTIPIGRPMPGARALPLDESGGPCPPGIVGEIHIRTPYRSLGYYRQAELTAQVFIPNPFRDDPQDLVYRTGDLGRVLENGNLELAGRRDQQIKIRGVRIEPAEIESALSACEGVGQAVAVAREDQPGEKRLVAYIVPRHGVELNSGDVQSSLRKRLPESMMPGALVFLKELPLTANGKVNRNRLPEPARASETEYVAPRTVEEELLCGLWEEVLQQERVGTAENFFQLGGHSLMATRLIARVRSAFGVELPLRALFEAPTVASLAERIGQQRRRGEVSGVPPIRRVSRERAVPLSYAQQRLWFLDQMEPNSAAYNMPRALRLRGTLRPEIVERAFREIVRRHEVLRTCFDVVEGEARQVIASEVALTVSLTDLASTEDEAQAAEVRRLIREEARRPFDLRQAPLIRGEVLRLGEQDHILLLTMHHIVSDGWSVGIAVREFAALYEAYSLGQTPALPELEIQYADYAVWQREWLEGEVLTQQLAYWRKQLEGVPPLELPTDFPRALSPGGAEGAIRFTLAEELTRELKNLSRREGVTLFMTLLAGFQLLLSRYSGQKDVAVGTPIAGRKLVETEGLIGFFVNTLVLRAELSGEPRFRELLRQVRETTLEAHRHQDVPFEKLVEELRPTRDLQRTPLFQVMFILQNVPRTELELSGLTLSGMETASETAKFDLTLGASEVNENIHGTLSYRSDLFAEADMRRLLGHWENLLTEVVADPKRAIRDLPMLAEAERRQVLEASAGTAVEYPRLCVHEMFERQARATPAAVAVEVADCQMTYAELDRRANQLAHYLHENGVMPDARVGICIERSAEMIAAVLAVLKAGAAYVPLDPQYPASRLAYMVEQSGMELLLTQERFLETLSGLVKAAVCLDVRWPEIARHDDDCIRVTVDPANLAYVIYTSGSTGNPKGVAMTQGALANLVDWQLVRAAHGPPRTLQFASLSFDVSFQEIFSTLCAGGAVILIGEDARHDPSLLWRTIRDREVTRLFLPFVALQQMAEAFPASGDGAVSLREIITAGEQLQTTPALQRLFAQLPACLLENQYGPSESHVVTAFRLPESSSQWPPLPSIGKAIANSQAYVLDEAEAGEPAPTGVGGELYLGGACLARGYINRPDWTAERFVPNPFSEEPGARLYRTGDMARYPANGDLDFLGRRDRQVKIRGFRVELREIEGLLNECAGVAQAVVEARDGQAGSKRLVAYVLPKPGHALSVSELRNAVRERLPEYMTPAAFVEMQEFPLTPSGKVDRRRLPEASGNQGEKIYVAPRSVEEEILCGLWEQVMKLGRIGVEDNFFELGGHSLLATQVISRVRQTFNVDLPVRSLFESPTVAALVERIRAAQSVPQPVAPALAAGRRAGRLPLSYAQERLWFIDQMEPGNSAYNIPFGMRLTGVLDKEALRRSLNEIVRRHESLRTTFPAPEGEAEQKIADVLNLMIEETEMSGQGAAGEEAVREYARTEADMPFDLAQGPLLRVKLVRLKAEEHILLVTMHHLVSDGWSIAVMVKEFSRLYAAYIEGKESPLEELKIQYADFAVWQRAWLRGEVLESRLAWWREHLAGIETLNLPTDYARKPLTSNRAGGIVELKLGEEMTGKLRELARLQQATLFMLMLAALDVVLWRYSEQTDIAVGTGIANRNRVEVEGLIGFFVNNLVVRLQVQGHESAQGFLRRVRHTTLEAYRHQDVPFEKLVAELQPDRDLTRTPLFQVALVLQNFSQESFSLPRIKVEGFQYGQAGAKTDLRLMVEDHDGSLQASVTYDAELFDRATVARLAGHWKHVLSEFAGDPERPVSELSLMDEEERRQVIEQWSGPPENDFWRGGIGRLLAQQVERTPEAAAVIWPGGEITYRELGQRVWRMARYLHELGAGPDERVAICLEPGPELIAAMLGAVAAGAAYVPLDPDYPGERLGHIVSDTQPLVLITTEKFRDKLPSGGGRVVSLEPEADRIAAQSAEVFNAEVKPGHLLYVIYTSGSTGRPKGVAVSQAALLSRIDFITRWYKATAQDRYAQMLSPSFDAFGGGLFSALLSGGALVFAPNEELLDPESLLALIRRNQITQLRLPVGYLRELLSHLLRNEITMPESIRLLVTGGETISRPEMRDWLRRAAPGVRFIHEYGPTETTITATLCEDDPKPEALPYPHRFVIGKPSGNTRIYVLGEHLAPLAVGTPGELYIGGAGVGRGYVEAPELTAEKFVPNPFSAAGGGRLYRTGDWARWLETGDIEFLGRRDDQVKVNGYRIELGEIEAGLRQHPALREAVVVVREGAHGSRQLVGYVVAARPEEAAPDAAELRVLLRRKLPEYMVPAAFVQLTELPLMPGGKLDRKRLPEPASEVSESAVAAPRSPAEEILCGLWAEVLRREQVGIEENFFELGGHSLLATQVMARVRRVFGVEMPLRALFEAPTVAGLAARIERQREQRAEPAASAIGKAVRSGPVPLSFAQQRLWFIDRLQPNSVAYNSRTAFRLKGELRHDILERGFSELVRRHEVLRTRFEVVEGEPRQVIAAEAAMSIPVEDLSALSPEEREAAARERVRQEAQRPFDLAEGPLLRINLLRLADDDHVLILILHHIVSDGWSVGIMVREFTALYAAYIKGEPSPLEDLEIQYADYAIWQRSLPQGQALEEQLAYWRKQLADITPLELPVDYPRTASESEAGALVNWALPDDLSKALKDLSRREGATLFMTMLAAFQLLLSRYSGQKDIAVGTPIAGRRWAETENLIGLQANTLVLRADLSGEPTFQELLAQVRNSTLEAYSHQDVPFEKLVEELRPERDLSRTPLFQAMLVLQNLPQTELDLPGMKLSGMEIGAGSARFDLELTAGDIQGRIRGSLAYRADVFAEPGMKRLVRHFENLLTEIVRHPEMKAGEMPLLSIEERRQILVEWNQTAVAYPQGGWVHELIERQAAAHPNAVAVRFDGQQLSYRELNRRTNQLANYLRRLGTEREDLVGICLDRSLEMVIGLVGIMKAGAAYVPLDPGHPSERLAYMVNDAGTRIVLSQAKYAELLPQQAVTIVYLEWEWPTIGEESPAVSLRPENLAYMIYTSGSTGRPKGAMNTHGGLLNRLQWMQQMFALSGNDRVLQKTPFSFDVSVWEFFWPLITGAQLVLAQPGGHQDPACLADLIQAEKITTIHFVPSMLRSFLNSAELEKCGSLRTVICSGEALSPEIAMECLERIPAELHNLYGPTEASIDVTCWKCEGEILRRGVPIGRPIANIQTYVLEETMSPAPPGVAGELLLGGIGLARGYLNRGDLTAEKFIPNPFAGDAGDRLYRTGDLVRYRENGIIEYLGRIDQQVKLRGYRIELGEIEAVLQGHPGVKRTAVAVREDLPGDQRLVAYVVPRGDETVKAGELRSYLKDRLPDYMVPSVFVEMKDLPLTSSGKLNRRSLPKPEGDRGTAESRYVAPTSPGEELLVNIWEDILRLDRVGVEDNFFELGGHSLLATQVISRIRQAFGVEPPLRALFECPTIAALAIRVQETRQKSHRPVPALVRINAEGPVPLSYGQERLWIIDRMSPGSAAYNIPFRIGLSGALNVEALRRSVEETGRRHAALRTRFVVVDGRPMQMVDPEARVTLEEIDLRGLAPEEAEAEAQRQVRAESAGPFDLARGPVVRVRLLRVSESENVLVANMHHIVSDAWSIGVALREIALRYQAYLKDEEPRLPELPIQYADYSVWQRQWLQGEVLNEQLDYWRERLAGVEPLDLPTDRPRPPVVSWCGASVAFRIRPDLSLSLQKFSRGEGVTLFMTLLAGMNVVLSRYSGQSDIAVGTPIAGRTRSETEGLIGFFVNMLVLRTRVEGAATFRALLERVKDRTLEAYEHQDVPFEKLVEELHPERDMSRAPLFQVALALQNVNEVAMEMPGLTIKAVAGNESETSKFDLLFGLEETPDGLKGAVEYNTDLFDRMTVEAMVRRWERVMEQAIGEPSRRIGELSLMNDAEREAIARQWAQALTPRPAVTESFGERLSRWSAEQAETPAILEMSGEVLSYGELNRRANQLAAALRREGVIAGQRQRVAVCVDGARQRAMACAAVLKLGAVVVGLDGDEPAARAGQMLTQSEAVVALCGRKQLRGLELGRPLIRLLEVETAGLSESECEPRGLAMSAESEACVLYHSDSAGHPVGVALRGRDIWGGIGDRRGVVAQALSFSQEAGCVEWLRELWRGGTVVALPADKAPAPRLLANVVRQHSVAILRTNAVMLERLAQQFPGTLKRIDRIVCDEDPEILRRLAAAMPSEARGSLYGVWGASEAGGYRTEYPVKTALLDHPATRTVIEFEDLPAGLRVHVLDREMRPAPPDTFGDIYVGGDFDLPGYDREPELTAERFVPDPLSVPGGARLYRTGERGRQRCDQKLELVSGLGASAWKSGGLRIALEEIESVLRRHEAVAAAAVGIVRDEEGGGHLEALVVTDVDGGQAPAIDDLRAWLKQRLPQAMLPREYRQVRTLPVKHNGEPDRRAVERILIGVEAEAGAAEYVAPRDPMEEQLAAIWARIFKVGKIGVNDNFFRLGGHSLLATQMVAWISDEMHLEVPLRRLFEAPTVAELARAIGRERGAAQAWTPLVPIQTEGTKPPLFMVHAVGGKVLSYVDLARRLGADQPLYGLEARHTNRDLQPHNDIESMAAEYVQAVRGRQPAGPWLLGGWSMGGTIAFEMARQLERSGEKVAMLVVIDEDAPGSGVLRWSLTDELLHFALYIGFEEQFIRASAGALAGLALPEQLEFIMKEAKRARLIAAGFGLREFNALWETFRNNFALLEKYRGGSYQGRVTVIGAELRPWPPAGWDKWASGGVELLQSPGDHFTMVREPGVKTLAKILRSGIQQALAAGEPAET